MYVETSESDNWKLKIHPNPFNIQAQLEEEKNLQLFDYLLFGQLYRGLYIF